MERYRVAFLVGIIFIIVSAIYYLESTKVRPAKIAAESSLEERVKNLSSVETLEKSAQYPYAQEISSPNGFINTEEIAIEELIGNKVILVDFWTYSCINCQRTTPYLNAWYEKYKDQGLEIIGIHTPEFEFEKKYENVLDAVQEFNIEYPVVLDNDFSTWYAYKNRYWPRKYLIDIDGYIVYDHIGEGAYAETEKVIQELLLERSKRLESKTNVSVDSIVSPEGTHRSRAESPEIYFGASRNISLANGKPGFTGEDRYLLPQDIIKNNLYLSGKWNITEEYAVNIDKASIIFQYQASKVHMVASADNEPVRAQIFIDGEIVQNIKGVDVDDDGYITFDSEQLYTLIDDNSSTEHILEIRVENSGLRAYAFTFG